VLHVTVFQGKPVKLIESDAPIEASEPGGCLGFRRIYLNRDFLKLETKIQKNASFWIDSLGLRK
jgi:hypothetical protein